MDRIRGRVIFVLIILISSTILVTGEEISDSYDTGEEVNIDEQDRGQTPTETTPNLEEPPEDVTYIEPTEENPSPTYDFTERENEIIVEVIPEETKIITTQGTISSFSMTNALFSLGSLIQGSFISFSNNNNIFFGSLFDASTFTATLNEEGSLEVGQKNSFGDMGKIVVEIENGNLTQDESIIFIPDGNNPEYIYYNTTEIEFKDGDLYLFGESVSNNDDTEDTSKVFFDENGFTKIELKPENSYSIFDYEIVNTGSEELIICKTNPLCDINIDESTFTIQGEATFSQDGDVFYTSFDSNNIFSIDTATGIASLENRKANVDILALLRSGSFLINESSSGTFYQALEEESTFFITEYYSLHEEDSILLKEGLLATTQHASFTSDFDSYESCLAGTCIYPQEFTVTAETLAPAFPTQSTLGVVLSTLLIIGLLSLFFNRKGKRKKGQFTLFIAFGFVLLIVTLLAFVYWQHDDAVAEITQIESLEDARIAVESCITESIEQNIEAFGMHGGYTEENSYSFSSFSTSYTLLSLEELQGNLEAGIERKLNDCTTVLDDTSYILTLNGRIHLQAVFGEEIEITGDSLGSISTEDGMQRITIGEIQQSFPVQMEEIYSLVQELQAEEWTPLLVQERYLLRTFYTEDFSEQLIQITDLPSGFVFQITKKYS